MSNIETLEVSLAERSYNIVIGTHLLTRAAEYIAPLLPSPRVIIVTDKTVGVQYGEKLAEHLRAQSIRADGVSVKPGEDSKSFEVLESLMERLLALTPDRKTTIIALGGGVIGDLAGFAASILLRGVPFMQVPTTLLAQVDSSVGGKTAINANAGKNLIGSFYQPQLVLIDLDTLKTLPPREMLAGYAEIIKYGLIMDADFYRWCLTNGDALTRGDTEVLRHAVLTSCRHKASVVAADERESGRRALLNFGHTFAHAMEKEMGYSGGLLHGEAVAVGMVMACRLSSRLGLIGPQVEAELTAHLRALGLPVSPREVPCTWNLDGFCRHFASDKKAEAGGLTFIVLEAIGRARVEKNVDPALAREVVASYLESAS